MRKIGNRAEDTLLLCVSNYHNIIIMIWLINYQGSVLFDA